jgi:hypothetical protein
MTKVNYFEVTPTDGKQDKVIKYARSKKEALAYATDEGIESTLEQVREMNFKLELVSLTDKELYAIRKDSTDKWKAEKEANKAK